MQETIDPIRPTNDEARALARGLMEEALTAALAVVGPDGAPVVTRIAFGLGVDGKPLSLLSDIAAHTKALEAEPRASMLVGEPGPTGDPLTHPRLTLQVRAEMVRRDDPRHEWLAEAWLAIHPKSKLWIGFGDFHFARFTIESAFLNGGFGKAFRMTPADLAI